MPSTAPPIPPKIMPSSQPPMKTPPTSPPKSVPATTAARSVKNRRAMYFIGSLSSSIPTAKPKRDLSGLVIYATYCSTQETFHIKRSLRYIPSTRLLDIALHALRIPKVMNLGEFCTGEVRRRPVPRNRVDRGKRKGEPSSPSTDRGRWLAAAHDPESHDARANEPGQRAESQHGDGGAAGRRQGRHGRRRAGGRGSGGAGRWACGRTCRGAGRWACVGTKLHVGQIARLAAVGGFPRKVRVGARIFLRLSTPEYAGSEDHALLTPSVAPE